jgi:hypothetical protein
MVVSLIALLATAASVALAGPPAGLEYSPPQAPPPPDAAGLLARLVTITLGLLALCGVVLWYARRVAQPQALKRSPRLRRTASLPLDRRSSLHLIAADEYTVAVTTDATGLRSMVLLSEPFDDVLAGISPPNEKPEAVPPPASGSPR